MFRKYYKPGDVDEALAILAEYRGRARVLAGGTDLVLQLKKKELAVEAVVDITGITELRYIREESGEIKIGALATHSDLSSSPLLRLKAPFLAEAAESVGSLQIRNVGTIGGNVVNAQPAADTAIPLLALDAIATVASPEGIRQLPFEELYLPGGGSAVDPAREIVLEFSFIPPGNAGGAGSFGRVARRKALCLPVFNTAVVLFPDALKEKIAGVRLAMGPVAPVPIRARKAEKILLERIPEDKTYREAAQAAAEEAAPRDSVFRGSSWYRKKLAEAVIYRNLKKAGELIFATAAS